MVFLDAESIKKLWDTWNIRGLIILSLLVQSFLVLFASMRKKRGGKWVAMIWVAYLLADWVATFTIGLILRTGSSDILVLWAPFLLLHLGGPDSITSYSLEDNELWLRHLLGLLLQVGSTIYFILQSFSQNKLWLSTLLVLLSGIIKYAERNYAFFLASFERFGSSWVPRDWAAGLPIPVQFQNLGTADHLPRILPVDIDIHMDSFLVDSDPKSILQAAVYLFGSIKNLLLGPVQSRQQTAKSFANFLSRNTDRAAENALRKLEIELSLLYEVLHTKLPVVVSKIGCVCRILNLVCILGALLSFSLVKKHYKLEEFDTWLTFGLLIGALALDFISVILLVFSDWFAVAHFHIMESGSLPKFITRFININKFINRHRWSNEVLQLNFITYLVKDNPHWLKKMAEFLLLKSLLEAIKGIRCQSSQNFKEDPHWRFIFEEVINFCKTVPRIKEVWFERSFKILEEFSILGPVERIIKESDYTQILLTWHIATELSFRGEDEQCSSTGSNDHRAICKLLSDYMFNLLMMKPAMMASVLNDWKKVFDDTYAETESFLSRSSVLNEKDASRKILSTDFDELAKKVEFGGDFDADYQLTSRDDGKRSVLFAARELATHLKRTDGYPWERINWVWVELICYAAANCKPNVHAQQPSKGGELLTFIWLCIRFVGGGKYYYFI
ncbi:hypothetical protein SLEP1_g47929 [Rubroshorea leprosula]|uniref:DUF4220 domain-containing protein n=1 Tax=Rubroshorea leprosula TaxID=152421 RepID=A0AAV5LSY8_9ROSI|nr:hypothetical protein SLEP1_g47929 [Rubroshorea leprosula]